MLNSPVDIAIVAGVLLLLFAPKPKALWGGRTPERQESTGNESVCFKCSPKALPLLVLLQRPTLGSCKKCGKIKTVVFESNSFPWLLLLLGAALLVVAILVVISMVPRYCDAFDVLVCSASLMVIALPLAAMASWPIFLAMYRRVGIERPIFLRVHFVGWLVSVMMAILTSYWHADFDPQFRAMRKQIETASARSATQAARNNPEEQLGVALSIVDRISNQMNQADLLDFAAQLLERVPTVAILGLVIPPICVYLRERRKPRRDPQKSLSRTASGR